MRFTSPEVGDVREFKGFAWFPRHTGCNTVVWLERYSYRATYRRAPGGCCFWVPIAEEKKP